jgi:hypothetical protein
MRMDPCFSCKEYIDIASDHLSTCTRNKISIITNGLAKVLLDLNKQEIYKKDIVIVHGDCPTGADAMIDWIAQYWNMTVEKHLAAWDIYGKKAGFVRNKRMVSLGAYICLAFCYNESIGTMMTVNLCNKAKIPVVLFTSSG